MKKTADNPKQRQREARKQIGASGIGTKIRYREYRAQLDAASMVRNKSQSDVICEDAWLLFLRRALSEA